jgi:hypothetical protein
MRECTCGFSVCILSHAHKDKFGSVRTLCTSNCIAFEICKVMLPYIMSVYIRFQCIKCISRFCVCSFYAQHACDFLSQCVGADAQLTHVKSCNQGMHPYLNMRMCSVCMYLNMCACLFVRTFRPSPKWVRTQTVTVTVVVTILVATSAGLAAYTFTCMSYSDKYPFSFRGCTGKDKKLGGMDSSFSFIICC